ncbi:MAG TPA: hypothetical protein PLG20_09100 [Candidatus Syntrophosphaera sp.]|nr:hypothetical protein [Candidatus Syntrophosphaera sp.]
MTDEEMGEAIIDYSSENDILPPDNATPASTGVKGDAVDPVK